jgi:glucokinase
MPLQSLIACCDLGGTKMMVGLATLHGELLASEKYLIGIRMQPLDVIADLDAAITRLLGSIGAQREQIVALGCGTAGVMNYDTGVIAMNHNVGWVDVPFRAMLEDHFGVPAVLEMDANAAALGEYWRGAAQGLHSFAFVIVGTGIGAGIVLNDQVVHGAHGVAGEIGHTVLVPNGPLCGCGKHGCLEALSSGLAIARMASAAVQLGRETMLNQVEAPLTAQHVVEAARLDDSVARDIIEDAAHYLGIGLANFITLFDPEAIVLGGGVGWGAYDLLMPGVNRALQQHLNYWAARTTPIHMTQLGEQAGMLGAGRAALATLSPDRLSSEAAK